MADRVAVVVGKNVITESEVLEEIRLTAFQNGQPPEFSPAARRAAAERMVDQQLIRREMEASGFPQPSPADVEAVYGDLRKQRYPADAQLHAALAKYGITEDELKQHLAWQLAALRFTDQRFRMIASSTPDGANREAPGAESVDQQMEAWLKEARSQTKIQFRKEAFQ